MARVGSIGDELKTSQETDKRVWRFSPAKRGDGTKVTWAKPKRVVTSALQFVVFAGVLGTACWAFNWAVTYLVGVLV